MADNSLDDFFAKKDKSKKKNKSKFTTSDILAKKDEEPKPQAEKKKKEKTEQKDVNDQKEGNNKNQDEEWIDFKQEEETDYTGLRIQTLQISREEEEKEDKEDGEEEVDEDGEVIERKDRSQGPWDAMQATTPAPVAPPPAPEPKVEEPPPAKSTGKYVPPGARASAAASANLAAMPSRRKPKTAPNITSEWDFPTLGGGSEKEREAAQSYVMSGSKFEKVRSGGRQTEDANSKGPQLTLGNKFDALRRE